MRLRSFPPVLIAGAALLLSSCGGGSDQPPAPPPAPVDAVTVRSQPVPNTIELPGRVEAIRTAEVRARTNGIIQARTYEEGSDVRAGQTLFRIDPRELQASLASAQATLTRARATEANARRDVARYRGLVGEQAISEQEFDAAQARLRQATADVAQASAQVRSARLSLDYATVTAPIAGRAGRAQVTEGALVSAAEGTLLTKIEQLHPIYVNFSQSNSALLDIRRRMASGSLDMPNINRVEVRLSYEDGTPYPLVGHLDFLDLSVDQSTGTVSLRAELPNPERALLPGQFVRARIVAGINPNGIVIPQRAVRVEEERATVFVIDKQGQAVERQVTLGEMQDGFWSIRKGLRPGERVITNGLQKVQPGRPVRLVKLDGRPVPAAKAAAKPDGKE